MWGMTGVELNSRCCARWRSEVCCARSHVWGFSAAVPVPERQVLPSGGHCDHSPIQQLHVFHVKHSAPRILIGQRLTRWTAHCEHSTRSRSANHSCIAPAHNFRRIAQIPLLPLGSWPLLQKGSIQGRAWRSSAAIHSVISATAHFDTVAAAGVSRETTQGDASSGCIALWSIADGSVGLVARSGRQSPVDGSKLLARGLDRLRQQ